MSSIPSLIRVFGNSLSVGYNLANPAVQNYLSIIQSELGCAINNYSIPSSCIPDRSPDAFNQSFAPADFSILELATNDVAAYRMVLPLWQQLHKGFLSTIAFSNSLNKVRGQDAGLLTTGPWIATGAASDNRGIYTNTPGATFSTTVEASDGKPVLVQYLLQDGNNATFTLAAMREGESSLQPLGSYSALPSSPILTPAFGTKFCPVVVPLELGNGRFVLQGQFTTLSPLATDLLILDSVIGCRKPAVARPRVLVLDTAYLQNYTTTPGGVSRADISAINSAVAADVAMLQAWGADVQLLAISELIDPSRDLNNTPGDSRHWNLYGHRKVAKAVVERVLNWRPCQ